MIGAKSTYGVVACVFSRLSQASIEILYIEQGLETLKVPTRWHLILGTDLQKSLGSAVLRPLLHNKFWLQRKVGG